jgi:hypothetical protein
MFTVRWEEQALNELADLWTRADSSQRQAITEASHQIDQQLSDDPENQGESRPLGCRILFAPPLGVIFHIEQHAPLVSVLHVWRFRQRGENATSP